MSEKVEALLKEIGIPQMIINQVVKITQKEEEAVNLALELMDNPEPTPPTNLTTYSNQQPLQKDPLFCQDTNLHSKGNRKHRIIF